MHIGLLQNAKCLNRRSKNLGGLVSIFQVALLCIPDRPSRSSQSVARLNTHWSNNPKMGKSHRMQEGFAGREDLEATQRYRKSNRDHDPHGGYDMVFDVGDIRKSSRARSRSRGRDIRDRPGRSQSPRRRERSRSIERYRERKRDYRRDPGR
jgi:peptidyl-prolyl cis-trans isomerase-like 4